MTAAPSHASAETEDAPPAASSSEREVLLALRPFAKPDDRRAYWQVLSTSGLYAATLSGIALLPFALKWLLLLPLAALVIRLFLLQHECGHLAPFSTPRRNDAWGRLLACLTGVAYEAWRTEHNLHHAHQGKLELRQGTLFSPMTVEEAALDPERAKKRARVISAASIFVLGAVGLMLLRKVSEPMLSKQPLVLRLVRNQADIRRSVRFTNLVHGLLQLAILAWVGPIVWLGLVLPAYLCAAGLGSWLLWIQHCYEQSYHAPAETWSYVAVGLQGSSYLRLPWLLNWVTLSVGIHHVHHLNARIPNFRLEEARRAVPAIAAIQPLRWQDLGKCFTHTIWDPERGRMVPLSAVLNRS